METIRLQKFFSDNGILSRRAAEAEIIAGRVKVNGQTAEIGCRVDAEKDEILWNGKRIEPRGERSAHTYIILNKPVGYVTTMSDEKGRKTAADLLTDVPGRVYPVGRLDMYSDGLLLCTDDGELANCLMHPSHNISKKYIVTLKGTLSEQDAARFTLPMTLDGYALQPVEARLKEAGIRLRDGQIASSVEITLHEGRNRQIRRMCEQLGYTVIRLRRISVGNIKLEDLPGGRWRYLTEEEIEYLKSAVKRKEK